jgi:hypothetical protein
MQGVNTSGKNKMFVDNCNQDEIKEGKNRFSDELDAIRLTTAVLK